MSWIAMPILVYQLTGSPLWTATVSVANATPYLVLGLFAGALADRRTRVSLMVCANLVSGLTIGSIPLMFLTGHLTALQVVVVAVVAQSSFVFYDAANFGFLVSLVGRDGILSANGFIYSSRSVLEAMAPAAVGLTISQVSVTDVMLFDAATFFVAAMLLTRISGADQASRELSHAERPRFWAATIEGLAYFGRNRVVGRTTLISALMTAANGGLMSVLIVWISRSFDIGTHDSRIAVFYTAIALSGIAAGRLGATAGRILSLEGALRVIIPLAAVLGYGLVLVHTWWLGATFLGLSSGLSMSGVVLAVSLRQRAIPDGLQSRVNTVGRMFAFGLGYSLGAVIAGGLGQAIPIDGALALVLLLRVTAAAVALVPMTSSPLRPEDAVPAGGREVSTIHATGS